MNQVYFTNAFLARQPVNNRLSGYLLDVKPTNLNTFYFPLGALLEDFLDNAVGIGLYMPILVNQPERELFERAGRALGDL